MSNESINNLPTSDNTFPLKLVNVNSKYAAMSNGNCLKQDNVSFLHKTVVNLHISYIHNTELKMLILININIAVMVLDLICVHIFYGDTAAQVKM